MTFLKKILINTITAKWFLHSFLRVHTFLTKLISELSIYEGNGIHPKHKILKYKEWFLNNIEPSWVILDVGCNTGLMPSIMCKKASYVYGVEIDPNHIASAEQQWADPNLEFICADATSFDYSFFKEVDCITLSNVLEHIDCRVIFLSKLISNVKWKGRKRFLIRVPMINRDWLVIFKKEKGLEYRLDNTHFTEYTYESFKNELDLAGIDIKTYEIRFGEIYAICEAKT